jgi:hypothetical protein
MTDGIKSTRLDLVLDRQMRHWEMRQQMARADKAERSAHAGGPWITCSKELGSRGTDLARHVAERLGWQAYDRELLSEIVQHTHARERVISALDEHATNVFRDYVEHLIVPGHFERAAFLRELMKVIWALGRQGNVVILGRGANWVLGPAAAQGLRIRLVASMETRIARVMELEKLDHPTAEKRILLDDAEKSLLIRKICGREIDDPLGYDLTINMDGLSVESGMGIVITALEKKLGYAVGSSGTISHATR